LPAPSMKEAMPHDAQRSAPGSRTHEPIECYTKFCKLVPENIAGIPNLCQAQSRQWRDWLANLPPA
jgi:hypothetical protein